MYECVICHKTTDNLMGWFLLQVSTAEYIHPDGVDHCHTTTMYCDTTHCMNAWCNRAQVEYEPTGTA